MSTLEKVICDKEDLVSIANAIRVGTGSTETFNVSELGAAAEALASSGGANITEEVNEYTGLLGELESAVNALPEAGGGGSAAPETCTVNINFKYGAPNALCINGTCVDGGSISALNKFYEGISGDTSTYAFENIVKNSGFAINGYALYLQGDITTENCELLLYKSSYGWSFYKITGTPATITIANYY